MSRFTGDGRHFRSYVRDGTTTTRVPSSDRAHVQGSAWSLHEAEATRAPWPRSDTASRMKVTVAMARKYERTRLPRILINVADNDFIDTAPNAKAGALRVRKAWKDWTSATAFARPTAIRFSSEVEEDAVKRQGSRG